MATANSRSSIQSVDSQSNEPLYQVKLLSALRSGDPALIQPFLTEIARERRASGSSIDEANGLGPAALHLAIRCASIDTVSLLLSNRAISSNSIHPPGSGTTALHLAASLGRADVVRLLLEDPLIDDTVKDSQGQTCIDVAKTKSVSRAIEDSRAFLDATYRSLLHTYILSATDAPPPAPLVTLLGSPRVKLVNLSYLDDASGTTLLHEAARRKDLSLIEAAVKAGADVFVRNRRGKTVIDSIGKDDKVKTFLRQFSNQDTSLIDDSSSEEPPVLRGYLQKYINVAKGYGARWFVLKDGVFSYYRHQEDETVASRGSIATKTAVLKVAPGGDKVRFEVHSTPSKGHTHVQKWYMKAAHPIEAQRWTQALTKSIAWQKKLEAEGLRRPSVDSQASGTLSIAKGRTSLSSTFSRRTPHITSGSLTPSIRSTSNPFGDDGEVSGAEGPSRDDEFDANGDASSGRSGDREHETPPHADTIDLHANAAAAQLELTAHLASSLAEALPPNAPPRPRELISALKEALSQAQNMIAQHTDAARDRERWYAAKLAKERARQKAWEDSLAAAVRESEALESQLRQSRISKRRQSRIDGSTAGMDTLKARPSGLPNVTVFEEENHGISEMGEIGIMHRDPESITTLDASTDLPPSPPTARPRDMLKVPTTAVNKRFSLYSSSGATGGGDDDDADTDDEDEFFDAIEANALPNLEVSQMLAGPHVHPPDVLSIPEILDVRQYAGYANPRPKLGITSDDRPPMSLWAVLKGSIGKDLTKISFPVFFNEPTSMLQRMAEDMEFSECLDAAAAEADPLRRIAFVAAFAMSNYSSTIGRIAKPFNPMLSETFEYVRLDKEYRYVSEQVSHHPPISACYAESPTWHYYGEVDAQNKFMGKSFEIRPTGVAHADLIIPTDYAGSDDYPAATDPTGKGKVVEHYSWKKVTTNISGFILGQPTIDHYGDMVVTNHRTGDKCVLTFKPRGWRGKDAYEISGEVTDSEGRVAYEIAGRWNSQLVARAAGAGSGALNPDFAIGSPSSAASTPSQFFLLWRNTVKPPAPFNLTPFAITLNDCPKDTLEPYLAPTDCRLRPDQRAFENGRYEEANTLKIALEESQRATRRAREAGELPPHAPRWFSPEVEPDTGERVWSPARTADGQLEYWAERTKVFVAGGRDKEGGQWSNVTPIFSIDA